VHGQLVRAGKLHLSGPVQVYEATPVRLEATRKAVADARAWLVGSGSADGPGADDGHGARGDPQP
jgi:hypothetical protein